MISSASISENCPCLVWVDEKSHKQTSCDLSTGLQEIASSFGHAFHCFKKAPTYQTWLNKAHPTEHVVVAAHRELKPLLSLFEQDSSLSRPHLLVVLMTDMNLVVRVRRVVRAMKRTAMAPAIELSVVESLDKLFELLQGREGANGQLATATTTPSTMTGRASGPVSPISSQTGQVPATQKGQRTQIGQIEKERPQEGPEEKQQQTTLVAQGRRPPCPPVPVAKTGSPIRRQWHDMNDDDDDYDGDLFCFGERGNLCQDENPAEMCSKPSVELRELDSQLRLDHLPGPVQQFMQGLFAGQTTLQIHDALLAAQPESYEL